MPCRKDGIKRWMGICPYAGPKVYLKGIRSLPDTGPELCGKQTKVYLDAFLKHGKTVPRRCDLSGGSGRVGQDILKGVYYALVLTVRNLVNFTECQKAKQCRCSIGVLYTYPYCLVAIGVPYSLPVHGCIVHIGVGLLRCSFLTFGHTRAPNREASDSAGLHAFYVHVTPITNQRYP